jgi:hypothetical protein
MFFNDSLAQDGGKLVTTPRGSGGLEKCFANFPKEALLKQVSPLQLSGSSWQLLSQHSLFSLLNGNHSKRTPTSSSSAPTLA